MEPFEIQVEKFTRQEQHQDFEIDIDDDSYNDLIPLMPCNNRCNIFSQILTIYAY